MEHKEIGQRDTKIGREDFRRGSLKIATSIMIHIVGPASAWDAGQHFGLLTYIGIYIFSQYLFSLAASKSSKAALFGYRYAPILLAMAGVISFISNSPNISIFVLPIFLGGYVGVYWTGYWDFKAFLKQDKDLLHIKMGIETPHPDALAKAKNISQPFAWTQFILTNAMRFVALQRSTFALAALVVISEVAAYGISLLYDKFSKSSNIEKIRKEWYIGQFFIICGIILMLAGSSLIFDSFNVFVSGWFLAQGAVRGSMRPREIIIANIHLKKEWPKPKSEENSKWGPIQIFQFMEVSATVVGVIISVWVIDHDVIAIEPGVFGSILAMLAFFLPLKHKLNPQAWDVGERREIGLRERLKFKSHVKVAVIFSIPAICLKTPQLVFMLLIAGFFNSILAVVWASNPEAIPDKKEERE